jgi:hypothetical protein
VHKSATGREFLANFWQTPPAAGAYGAFVLVELRGFEPLTSAMRTNAAPFTPAFPNQQRATSAQVSRTALSHSVGPHELP